jgi:hypothetical protein
LNILIPIDHDSGVIDWEEVRQEIHPRLADEAKTAQFLAGKGEVLTSAATESFLDAVLHEFLHATDFFVTQGNGDYSPDQHLQSLPEYRQPKLVTAGAGTTLVLAGAGKAKSCLDLSEAYVKDVEPRASTISLPPSKAG